MPVRAVLFDFDGTLADSFSAITASTNHVRQSCGLPVLSEAEVRSYVGLGLPNLMTALVPSLPPEEAVRRYREHHPRVMLTETKLFPGVIDTLSTLKNRGLRMAVCSNKAVTFTRQLVEALGLSKYIETTLGPEDVGVPKPDPAMLLEACRRLESTPADTIYVGDMSVDVLAGNAAQIPVCLVNVGLAGHDDPTAAGTARILSGFADIADLLS